MPEAKVKRVSVPFLDHQIMLDVFVNCCYSRLHTVVTSHAGSDVEMDIFVLCVHTTSLGQYTSASDGLYNCLSVSCRPEVLYCRIRSDSERD